jgi:dihydrofolate synthase / folylpolyglutamate synthase
VTDYESALAWLYGLEAAKGMDFKLERVELALASLGDPQRSYPSIHVAGTNGKGSAAAMIQSMLSAAGYRVGLYISPHLVRFTERIRIGAEEISEDEAVALVGEIRRAATSRGIDLTFFEFVTVLGLLHFARRGVDAAVVEVGLGGRLDATNVIDPEVAVITTIGLDHQEYLGETIEQVAAEKGGILKRGRPAVFGRLRPAARKVLEDIAAERGARVWRLGEEFSISAEGPADYAGPKLRLPGLAISLRGAHQRDNAAVAIAALETIAERLPVGEEAMRAGLAQTIWPGRLEVFPGPPSIVLDGAHNPDGVETLVEEMRTIAAGRKVHLLFGVMRDKDWGPMAQGLAEIADDVTVTHVFPPRGEAPERLAAVFERSRPVRIIADPAVAFARVTAEAGRDDVVLVAGSLFLIGAVYPTLEQMGSVSESASGAEVSRR